MPNLTMHNRAVRAIKLYMWWRREPSMEEPIGRLTLHDIRVKFYLPKPRAIFNSSSRDLSSTRGVRSE
jgi:hypothetical protein